MEKPIGFPRASRIGSLISIAGTAPIQADGLTACPGDIYGQTYCCLEIIQKAITDAGGKLDDVIQIRVMLTDRKALTRSPIISLSSSCSGKGAIISSKPLL
ncbi:MAG: Rid family hydrolase [Cyanobacteria bacterium J06638_6]